MNSKYIARIFPALVLASALVHSAFGAVLVYDQDFTSGFANSGNIPDGDPSGWQNSQTVSGLDSALGITGVRIVLGISGGWNGDLYGWVRHESTGGIGF